MRIPASTYRIQFYKGFGFNEAEQVIEYLHELGITDLYASPLLKARRGSRHGYDITDPTQLNPELGTPREFDRMTQALRDRQMGLILDVVPNHMAASPENPWWFDVLEKGEASPYAAFFDVNWESKKVLLPILGTSYEEALKNRELKLRFENGRPLLQYHEQRLPVAAGAESWSSEGVDRVLSRQHYRLAYWRKAADAINYRRFFDISDLVGVRAESKTVFDATHSLVLRLINEGKVSGIRIDHIDGLADPQEYLERLPGTYVVVEKILAGNERLPDVWQMHGTTGYDFLNSVNGAFVDRAGFAALARTYSEFTGLTATYAEAFRERKRQVMKDLFAGEVNTLVRTLAGLAERDRHARDLPAEELHHAFIETTASLPVYRTYIRGPKISDTDRSRIEDAIAVAGGSALSPALSFLRRVLLVEPSWYLQVQKPDYLSFVMQWQQFTGAVMAKGLEDTTFYVQNPLISLNEVGGDPHGPEVFFGVEQFHRRNQLRRERWPYTMNATSTHDTKRSEDVRVRINVLSELHEEWAATLQRWSRMNTSDFAPDRNEQVLIYQTMLGAWPIEPERLKQFLVKALREAKTHTNWLDIDQDYENRVLGFVDRILESGRFLRSFTRFQKKIAHFGALSSLSQLLLKIASPGVPDFYQGTELWDFSLADPDNRRDVDFSQRVTMLRRLKERARPARLLKTPADGRIKMYLTWKALNYRAEHRDLFLEGEYMPLRIAGARQEHLIAFARRHHDNWAVVAVPRLLATLGDKTWDDTAVQMPDSAPSQWINVLTGDAPDLDAFPYLFLRPAGAY